MENTHRIQFESNEPEWFVAMGSQWIGPLRPVEVLERIQQSQVSWAHFAWKKGMQDWIRLCDIDVFAAAVPETPSQMLIADVQRMMGSASTPQVKPSTRPPGESGWFLFYNDTQWGPFSTGEVIRSLQVGNIHGRVHVWRDGMKGWQRLEELTDFASALPSARAALVKEEGTREMRRDERKPIIARILLSSQKSVFVGVCRDISLGGMQVLTDQVPGPVGTKVHLNVSPVDGATRSIAAFTASGVIVRVLEDGRGFSFRFDALADQAKRTIEQFIAAS